MRMFFMSLFLGLGLASLAPATAGPLEDGIAAYQAGDAEARRIFEQDAFNQVILGVMYENGKGVPQDYAEAVRWYRLAAEQGNALGQGKLGNMYFGGLGVPQDYVEAVKWYRLVAEQGNADAQFTLGLMYENGWGVPQDYVLAHMWFNLAAAQGDATAVANRDIAAKKMTPAQIAEAQQLAREWKAAHP